MPCQERERLAAVYLAAVAEANESKDTDASVNGNTDDDDAVLLALYNHQVEHGC
jgi:hypothetical protein